MNEAQKLERKDHRLCIYGWLEKRILLRTSARAIYAIYFILQL